MTTTPIALTPGSTLTGSTASILTSTGTTIITSSSFANPTSASITLVITITRANGSPLTLVPGRPISGNGTVQPAEISGLVLGAGDTISASGNGLTAVVNGYVVA